MHTQVVKHWWNSKQGMARKTIHIRRDPATSTCQLELVFGRDERGRRWTRVYVNIDQALAKAQSALASNPDEDWRDITGAHHPVEP